MHMHCGCLISNFKFISIMNLTQTNALRNIQNIQKQSHLMQAHIKKKLFIRATKSYTYKVECFQPQKGWWRHQIHATCVWLKMTNNTQITIKSILLDCYLILLLSIVHIISVEYQLSSRFVFILFNCIFLLSSLVFDLFFFSYSLLFLFFFLLFNSLLSGIKPMSKSNKASFILIIPHKQ